MLYNYYRDYNPLIGRYVESDPIGLRAGLNTYLYARGNPISYRDPWGLDVTVYNFYNGANGVGHIGLGVNDNPSVGFYPRLGDDPVSRLEEVLGSSTLGQVRFDNMNQMYNLVTIKTTSEQDRLIQGYIDRRVMSPGNYNLFNRQCSAFVADALRAGGVEVPGGPENIIPNDLFRNLNARYWQ